MYDPFAGRHPPPRPKPLPRRGLPTLAPVRCCDCRSRLTSKKWMPPWVKWCKKCRQTVAYLTDEQIKEYGL
jgi:hypothetical protein